MTDQDWLACTDPMPMLVFLRGKASDRKMRLFAIACCQRIAAYLNHDDWGCRTNGCITFALSTSERFADGLVDENEWHRARIGAGEALSRINEFAELPENELDGFYTGPPLGGARAACATTELQGYDSAIIVVNEVARLMERELGTLDW